MLQSAISSGRILARAFISTTAADVQPIATGAAGSEADKALKTSQWKAAIDFKWIRDNKESVAANMKNRNSNANLHLVLQLYEKLLNLQKEVDRLRAERNNVANKMKAKLEPAERQKLIEEGKNLKDGLVTLEEDLLKLTDELQKEAQSVPNMTHPDVPIGGEDCSTVKKLVGKPREYSFPIKDHVQLGKDLDLYDFDAASENLANPTALLLSAVTMLRHLDLHNKADRIQDAVLKTTAEGKYRTGDLGGKSTTTDFTNAICDHL